MDAMINIVCTTDSKYLMPTGIMIKSACVNNKDTDLVFHVIADSSVGEEDKDLFRQIVSESSNASICFYDINETLMKSFPNVHGEVQPYITQAAYYRLFVADILPKDIDKVLYLDGDIIVRKSLTELWDTDVRDYTIACVNDMSESIINLYNRLQIPVDRGYLNSGVLLINLKKWRETNITEAFLTCIKDNYDIIKFHDQDVLNIVCNKTKLWLPITYNFQNGFFFKREYMSIDYWKYANQIEKYKKDPAVVHFMTTPKPWFLECDHPYWNEFMRYKSMTPWANVPLKREYNPPFYKKAGLYIMRKLGILSNDYVDRYER